MVLSVGAFCHCRCRCMYLHYCLPLSGGGLSMGSLQRYMGSVLGLLVCPQLIKFGAHKENHCRVDWHASLDSEVNGTAVVESA